MNKRNKLIAILLVPIFLILAKGLLNRRDAVQDGNPVIEMTAENFKFTPREIRVKAGAHVTIKLTSLDDKHGIAFKVVPEGQPEGSPPGLRFDTPKPDWPLQRGKEKVIQFVAERPGTYEFSCSVFCGMGHNGMLGRVIVE